MIAVCLCHNELHYTRAFVESVLASKDNKEGLTIVMVDNASTDDTLEYIKQISKDNEKLFRVLENKENKLFTIACKEVIDNYPGEDVYLINNDIIVKDGWLHGREFLKDYGMIGATQLSPIDNNFITFAGGGDDFASHIIMWKWKHDKEFTGIHDAKWLTFGACMINRKAYDAVGGLNLDFEFYCSDSDMSLTMIEAGFKLGVDPDMTLIHFGGATTNTKMQDPAYRQNFIGREDQIKFAEKWGLKVGDIDLRHTNATNRKDIFNSFFNNPNLYERNKRLSIRKAKWLFDTYNLKGKKVLELGCAFGNIVTELRNLGVEAYGVDISDYALSKNPQPYLRQFDIEAQGVAYAFPEVTFDFIYSCAVLEHLNKQSMQTLFSDFNRILNDTGEMYHEIDTEQGIDRTHINIISPFSWEGMFGVYQFKTKIISVSKLGMMKIEVKR